MSSTPHVLMRPIQVRSNAPSRTPGPPPAEPLPAVPKCPLASDSDFPPAWANAVTRFSTLSGATTLSQNETRALKKVPREGPSEDLSSSARVTRTRSLILLGQRIDFSFQTGPRHLKGKGMPVYSLANAPLAELSKHMLLSGDKVMEPFGLRRIRIRVQVSLLQLLSLAERGSHAFQWPFPLDGETSYIATEEWINTDVSMTRAQLAMSVAVVFRNFFEKYRVALGALPDYAWYLRPDAFYKIWLVGLERTENNVFAADIRYVRDFPGS
ncbi:hypothetical protein BV20DRAFT_967012 [Pilatotrama ljubarskyi]|nr:hypothetical protein BV20DRAFT_967012 [Pilatotrama ljubarskyi]